MFNILEESCIEVRILDSPGTVTLTLPEVLASLGTNTIETFTNLRPHQRHPWHAFLCQLAAIALSDGGVEIPPADTNTPYSHLPGEYDEGRWKELLMALAPDPDAWSLVVEDSSKPAFLQAPIPNGFDALGILMHTPDKLDVIIAAKNCDEKSRRITSPKIDHWLFALVSLQGQAGYSKAGPKGNYYNTARQNGAYATRPSVGIIPSPFWGDQWGRDCRVLIDALLDDERSIDWNIESGHRLLWLLPWEGTTSLNLEDLHPYFLEVCRRIRLRTGGNGEITAHVGSSTTGRIAGGMYKGAVDDPWIPVNKNLASAFNSRPSWVEMGKILLDRTTYEPSRAQIPAFFDRSPIAVRFCVLVRGQSKTDELHEKIIPVPARKLSYLRLQNNAGEQVLSTMIDTAKKAKKDVLSPSFSLLLTGKEKKRKSLPLVSASILQLDDTISDSFFPYLWEALPEEGEQKNDAQRYNPWIAFLRSSTREIFEDVLRRCIQAGGTDFVCAADAELFFSRTTNKNLPFFQNTSEEEIVNE